jgi:hypothetical protein
MGFSFLFMGCVKRPKERRNERHTINGWAPAATTKEKPARVIMRDWKTGVPARVP